MANQQFGQADRLDDCRKELDTKIEKKVSEIHFWAAVTLLAAAVGGTYLWLMNLNERISKIEGGNAVIQTRNPK